MNNKLRKKLLLKISNLIKTFLAYREKKLYGIFDEARQKATLKEIKLTEFS